MVNNLIGSLNKKVEKYNSSEQHRIIISCLPMLHALSVKIARRTGHSSEDLFQESVLGLLRAVQSYEGKNGAKFSTYAYFWALAFIEKYIDRENKNINSQNNEYIENSITSPENILLEKEKKKELNLSLLKLDPIQLKIISLRFFSHEKQNKSFKTLAEELCITETKLNKIYKIALSKLRRKIQGI